MSALKFQVTIPFASMTPADVSINTWHFRTQDDSQTSISAVVAALAIFYTAVKTYYPASASFSQAAVKVYRMSDPKPRPPIFEGLLGTTGSGVGQSGPPEVAICMSFHGTKVAGVAAARTRGRIYLGPFGSNMAFTPTVAGPVITALVAAAQGLLDLSNNNTYKWVVWSQAQSDDPQGTLFPDQTVTGGWFDNAWDTQRRRGVAATSRVTFGSPPLELIE